VTGDVLRKTESTLFTTETNFRSTLVLYMSYSCLPQENRQLFAQHNMPETGPEILLFSG
jgi:hypothetical protein